MKKKELLKRLESIEQTISDEKIEVEDSVQALITIIQMNNKQQTEIMSSQKFLRGQITRLWDYVQSERNSSYDVLKKQIAKLAMEVSNLK